MRGLRGRHLVSLRGVDDGDLRWLVERTMRHAAGKNPERTLENRIVGIYFALTSTRTRTAFTTGALRLGAHTISYGPGDLQLNTGESVHDTGRVLAAMLDALVVRMPGDSQELLAFAPTDEVSVINAMSFDEHPTQALADLATMHQQFGRLDGLRVLYVGEGNSTATALRFALSRFEGVELYLRTPPDYGLPAGAREPAVGSIGGRIEERHDLHDLPDRVDVVYTTRWQTTGTDKKHADWRATFAPFRVDAALMDRFPGAVFMHDLPAHRGDEVTAAVIDGPRSVVFQQAANKLYSAMAALEWCLMDR